MNLISKEEVLDKFADYVGSGMSMNDYDALSDIVQNTPYINIYSMFHKLSTKYKDIGLKIYIEFTEFGMILRGYWKLEVSTLNFSREYSYEMLEHALDGFCLEEIVDKFKNEFEYKLHDHEAEIKTESEGKDE